jgi:hypothetical protein
MHIVNAWPWAEEPFLNGRLSIHSRLIATGHDDGLRSMSAVVVRAGDVSKR